MRKLTLFMHVSLDGFVAGPNGEMNWIKLNNELFDYVKSRTDEADTALYGRVTYEMMEAYWPGAADKPNATKHDIEHSTWYNKVSKVVLSKSMKDKNLPNTKIISNHLSKEIKQLKKTAGKDIIMFGSPSASHSLMRKNLIDAYWFFVNPVLLGKGIPLFKGIKKMTELKFVESIVFPAGVISLHYEKIG